MAIARQRIHVPPGAYTKAIGGLFGGGLWEGPEIESFELAFSERVGASHAVAVASGRAGLRVLLQQMNLPEGSEVICSAFGYPVVPHLVKALGYKLRFVDCEMRSLGMDPAALERAISEKTACVIVTHLYGVPAGIRRIVELAEAHGAKVIEDCAHCLGSTVGGRHVGTIGDAGYFSFETSKMINTLGGGMLTIRDAELVGRVRAEQKDEEQRSFGWLRKRLMKTTFEAIVTHPVPFNLGVYPALRLAAARAKEEDRFASGYQPDHFTLSGRTGRFTNYQAAIGKPQLGTADRQVAQRIKNAERLFERVGDKVWFQRPADEDGVGNYMLVTAMFEHAPGIASSLLRRGIDTKYHYMRDCAALIDTGERFSNAERADSQVLHLPAHPELSIGKIDKVADAVLAVLSEVPSQGARSTQASS